MRIAAYRVHAIAACLAIGTASSPLLAEPYGTSGHEVVRVHNEAYSQGDFERFIATFADDAVVIVEGYEYRGRDEIAASYAPSFGPGAPRAIIERQGRASGGGIVQRESYLYEDGTQVCCTVTAIWVEDGQIARVLVDNGGLGG